MVNQWWSDDDQLLGVLKDALSTEHAVPPEFIEAGKAAYAWRTIDAELATLTYDSASEAVSATRAESATLRALTFASADLTIELEVTPDALLGQISPVQSGRITAYVGGTEPGPPEIGTTTAGSAAIDELGFFILSPVPAESFRLLCQTASGTTAVTGLISP